MTSLNTCSMCAYYKPNFSSEGICTQHEKPVLGRSKACALKACIANFKSSGETVQKKVRVRK